MHSQDNMHYYKPSACQLVNTVSVLFCPVNVSQRWRGSSRGLLVCFSSLESAGGSSVEKVTGRTLRKTDPVPHCNIKRGIKYSIRYFLQSLMSFFSLLCDAYILACSWSEYNTDYVFFLSFQMQSECSYIKKNIKFKINIHLLNIYLLVLVSGLTLTYTILQCHRSRRANRNVGWHHSLDVTGAPLVEDDGLTAPHSPLRQWAHAHKNCGHRVTSCWK